MTNDELEAEVQKLKRQLDALKRLHLVEKAKGNAFEMFLTELCGESAKEALHDCFKKTYGRVLLDLEKKHPGFSARMDMRQNLPEDQQMEWFGTEDDK